MSAFQLGAAAGNFAHIGSLLAGLAGSIYFLTILIRNSDLSFKEALFYKNERMSLLTAVFPYIVLIASVLIFQLPMIKSLLPDLSFSLSFPGFTTDLGYSVAAEEGYSPISLFSHPIFFLLLASLSGGTLYFYKEQLTKNKVAKIFKNSLKKSSSSAANVFLLLILALVMNDSGMIFNFAKGVANISGMAFPILSPVIGILGAFLTGSNTSSNVLFGAFQVNTANLLNFPPEIIASTQSVGGSLGSAIAPAKIILGTAVVGIKGKEGEIIKRAIGYTLISGLLVGLAAFIVTMVI
jgi:lactate permease